MSQQALFLVTDEKTILNSCKGWMPPLQKARTKKHKNPFTGETSTVTTLVPKQIEERSDSYEPTIEELEAGPPFDAHDELSKAKPISAAFTLPPGVFEVIKRSPPFLYGSVQGEVHKITRISPEHEAEHLQFLGDLAGPWVDEQKRRHDDLSIFIYVYSY